MSDSDKIYIFDTTLRDGEQSAGIGFTIDEKVEIARQLGRVNVDIIEAGFPATSPGDREAIARITREVKGPIIAGLARAVASDIDTAWEALRGAETMLRPSFMARDQALTLETPDAPLRAIGDERALEQVMLNLLSNANRRSEEHTSELQSH